MPGPSIAEALADREDLCSASEVEPEPDAAVHQLQLEEVVVAAVVGVKQDAVRIVGQELELDGRVRPRVPLPKLSVRCLRPFKNEGRS